MSENVRHLAAQPKVKLRRKLCKRRRLLSLEKRASFDKSINRHLLELVDQKHARSIACYKSFDGEPDITPACKQLLARDCALALPVISVNGHYSMTFHAWRAETPLIRNRYGICEPETAAPVSISGFDMLIMPLVGYDLSGNRLGMGAGYYDRHLEPLRDSATPMRVGVAYSLQEIEHLKYNSWDIPLHAVVNERGWFTLSNVPSSK